MNIDFPLIMVLLVFFTGSVWAMDVWLFAPKRKKQAEALGEGGLVGDTLGSEQEKAVHESVLVEYSRSLFPVILAVLVLRSFMVEPFRIPSGSMMPTLLVGDFILVNKFAYGIRLPVVNTKLFEVGHPQRGDVVVFRYPKDPSVDYIKRVIGLPGDKISYVHKKIYVNNQPVSQSGNEIYLDDGPGIAHSGSQIRIEDLSGVKHNILLDNHKPILDGEYQVPNGQYFVMGDNRDNSNDSRYWGTVPEDNLVGKAFMVWMNWHSANSGIGARFDRVGTSIK